MRDIQREAGSAVKPRGRRESGRARRRPPEVANAAFLSGRVPVSVPAMKVRLSDSMVRFRLSPAEASDWLATGNFEVVVNGVAYPATLQFAPFYDPQRERVRG